MSVLWETGEATVNEIREKVDPALAYTSVSSLIRLLELKGYVAHRRGKGKTHLYYAVIDSEAAGASALDRVLQKIYGGSPTKLLAHLVEKHRPTQSELEKMRALLKRSVKAG